MRIFANRACLSSGWAQNVTVTVDAGIITRVTPDSLPQSGDVRVDALLPALANVHSHAFQRAMAGLTEYRAKGRESFWTWRDLMYRHLDRLTPDHMNAIAALAYAEMLEAGYCAVGEFHYVHHAPGGHHYDDLAETSSQVMQAAAQTGIGLTHLPVLYTYGGIDGQDLAGGQLRFGNGVDAFLDLVERCRTIARSMAADTRIGIAPHSLRATSPGDLAHVLSETPTGPVHIHIAEQTREVAQVQAALNARPVEWLLGNANVSARWCLIHATHMTQQETQAMAKSGAVAGLCPVTEANLGDGVFNGKDYVKARGAIAVGTDSNVNIALADELRLLEYSQRLHHRERNVMLRQAGSVGDALYHAAASGGARALQRNSGAIETGKLADLVALDTTHPALCLLNDAQLLDGFVFAGGDKAISDVWAAGRHQVQGGRHIAQHRIRARYREALADLMSG